MSKDLFSKLPLGLFRPLAAKHNRLYWQIITRLYHKLFDEDIEVGEFGHAKAAVTDVIENVMEQYSALWLPNADEDEDGDGADIRVRANQAYTLLRESGWLEEARYGYHDYVSMLPRVSQSPAALIEIAEGRPLIMTGKLKALRSGIRTVADKPREEADTLIELAKDAGRFARHMNSIRSSIKELYDRIQSGLTVREVVNGFFDEFLREIFIRDYATLKTTENPLTIRDELLTIVAKLRYTPEIKNELQQGYMNVYGSGDEIAASNHLERDLSKLEHVFMSIERQFDAIDQMKVRYEQRVDTVIDYATRSPRSIGRDLQRLADAMSKRAMVDGDSITVLLPLVAEECFGEPRFAQVRTPRKTPEPRKVQKRSVSIELLQRSREERAAKEAIQVDEDGLLEYLRVQMGSAQTLESPQLVVNNVRDYFCVLNLQRAARLPEMAQKQYPSLVEEFALDATEEWAETDYFKMRKAIVTRKG